MGNAAFLAAVGAIASFLVGVLVYGFSRFPTPPGRIMAFCAILALAALLGFVVFVLVLSESARLGSPF